MKEYRYFVKSYIEYIGDDGVKCWQKYNCFIIFPDIHEQCSSGMRDGFKGYIGDEFNIEFPESELLSINILNIMKL